MFRKYFCEIIATFILVFMGTGAGIVNQQTGGVISHAGIAIVWGLVVMALIFALGDISGTHMNPAVTIAFTIDKRFKVKHVIPYIVSQSIGAFLASLVLKFLYPANETLGATLPAGSVAQSFILEFILTFFLMLVVISVSTGSKETGMFAALAIGGVVTLEAMFAGPASGASMNPIRSIAPAIVSGHTQYLWVYITAPIAGAATAIPTFNFLKKGKKVDE
ncbi:MAG TPA: aquaporin [Segetibacter sp.]|jgi:aquaporin Z